MKIGLSLFVIAIGTLAVWAARRHDSIGPRNAFARRAGAVEAFARQRPLWIVRSGKELGAELEELTLQYREAA
jgi:hypothetical protein